MTASVDAPARTVETLCKYLGLLNGAAPLYRSALRVAAEVHNSPAFGEPFARERLAMQERAAGADHRDVAIAVAALAALLDAQDRIDEAEPLYRRALRIFQRHPQRDGNELAVTLSGLAAIRHAKGHPGEAARLYHRALVIRRRLLPADIRRSRRRCTASPSCTTRRGATSAPRV